MSEAPSPTPMTSTLALACAIGLSSALLTVLALRWLSPPPAVAVVQIDRVLAEHVAAVSQRDWNPAQQQAEVQRFASALEASLVELSDEGRIVLLNAPAVLGGAPDRTPELRIALQRRLSTEASRETAP
ncbi:MAG: TrbI F-type domain-containing protein [Pseudomonadota bacterium]|nr:TrbI F-type domain-containing protein [Pseudomonadota bacterium]